MATGFVGCASDPPPASQTDLAVRTDQAPASPAGEWLTRLIAIGNGSEPVPAVEEMPNVFGPLVLDRQTWAEARAALEILPRNGPYTLVGFASAPEDYRLQALVERRQGEALIDVVVEPTGDHRLLRAMVTPIRPTAR